MAKEAPVAETTMEPEQAVEASKGEASTSVREGSVEAASLQARRDEDVEKQSEQAEGR